MFWNRINELEEQLKEQKLINKELDKRIWSLENPPKYKVGDTVKFDRNSLNSMVRVSSIGAISTKDCIILKSWVENTLGLTFTRYYELFSKEGERTYRCLDGDIVGLSEDK